MAKKLTHEEADRRIMEATKSQKTGLGFLDKLREISQKRKTEAGAETPPVSQ